MRRTCPERWPWVLKRILNLANRPKAYAGELLQPGLPKALQQVLEAFVGSSRDMFEASDARVGGNLQQAMERFLRVLALIEMSI